ncbi:hypothetical protein MRX96_053984 [Rhipicephalus microplus]
MARNKKHHSGTSHCAFGSFNQGKNISVPALTARISRSASRNTTTSNTSEKAWWDEPGLAVSLRMASTASSVYTSPSKRLSSAVCGDSTAVAVFHEVREVRQRLRPHARLRGERKNKKW